MHSRIYQVSTKPISKEEYIGDFDIPEWFVGSIADYTSVMTDRKGDIENLASCLERVSSFNDEDLSLTFNEDVTPYFAGLYDEFIKAANELVKTSFEQFAHNSLWPILYNLQAAYNDKYDVYIYDENGFLHTLSEFMRELKGGETYYFGATIDYHY